MAKKLRCRNCGAHYEKSKSRSRVDGYCTRFCVEEKARRHGWKKLKLWQGGKTFEEVLAEKNLIGDCAVEDL